MKIRSIALASDHAGYELKLKIIKHLEDLGYENIHDVGAYSTESSDYPDFAHKLAEAVESDDYDIGISLCGSGNGINMTANKHQGIRSALCWSVEISRLARAHNDANICALPARFIDEKLAIEVVDIFLKTEFEGGRHLRRVKKIPIKK
jgi:ribose 5-phosphate isomerase B